MADAHKNFAQSLVATAPSPATSGISLVVTGADGAKFPATPFNATIWPAGVQPTTTNAEIVRVTAISTDTFTIVRTQESTSARTVIIGDQISANVTVKTMTDTEKLLTGITGGSLSASTAYVAVDTLEISATDTLEIPATSTVEIEPILRSTNLRNDQFYTPYMFSVYRNAALTPPGSNVLTCDTKEYDIGSNVDIVTNLGRFTAPVEGFYHFNGQITVGASARALIMVFKNGVEWKRGTDFTAGAGGGASAISVDLKLIAGDYVEIVCNTGGTALVVGANAFCYFQGALMSVPRV